MLYPDLETSRQQQQHTVVGHGNNNKIHPCCRCLGHETRIPSTYVGGKEGNSYERQTFQRRREGEGSKEEKEKL